MRIPEKPWAILWELAKAHGRLAIPGLGFCIRPAVDIAKSDLDRVRTLRAIAVQYTTLDAFRGAVPTIRYLLAALELGELNEVATAIGLEAAVRAGLGWRRGALRLIGILDDLALRHANAMGAAFASMSRSVLELFTGDRTSAVASAERAIRDVSTLSSPPTWLLSAAHYVEQLNLVFALSTASFERVLAFVEEREERSGPCAELRSRAFGLRLSSCS